jgi:hypothetical protein
LALPPGHPPEALTPEALLNHTFPLAASRVPSAGALRALVDQLLQDHAVREAIERVLHPSGQGHTGEHSGPTHGPAASLAPPTIPEPPALDAHTLADAGGTLLETYAQVLMPVLAKLLATHLDAVAEHATAPQPTGLARPLPLPLAEYLYVLSAAHYQAVREVLAYGTFAEVDGSPWPTARLAKGHARGHAQLRPVVTDQQPFLPPEDIERWTQIMARQRGELSDLDADTLDALSAIWLYQATDPNDAAVADVDDLLTLRGLVRNPGGQGRRGGYKAHQRMAMWQSLTHIQNLWLTMAALETYDGDDTQPGTRRRKPTTRALQSRAFIITDLLGQLRLDGFVDVEKFIFRPGQVFAHFLAGPGRQTALLSAKALQYDPYRQTWEKRLTRYLSWQWRCAAQTGDYLQPFTVTTLLTAVGSPVNRRRLTRQREHLEHTLDTIQHDGVLSTWQYAQEHADWPKSTLLLEPPEPIRAQYERLAQHEASRQRLVPPSAALGARLKHHRQALGLSQIQAAEQLALHQGYFSRLERGHVTPSPAVRKRLEAWCTREA